MYDLYQCMCTRTLIPQSTHARESYRGRLMRNCDSDLRVSLRGSSPKQRREGCIYKYVYIYIYTHIYIYVNI